MTSYTVTVVDSSGSKRSFPVPRGMDRHYLTRKLHQANRGETVVGLTEREAEWVADVIAQLQETATPENAA